MQPDLDILNFLLLILFLSNSSNTCFCLLQKFDGQRIPSDFDQILNQRDADWRLETGGLGPGPRVISETRRPETSLKSADYQVFCCLGPRGGGGGDATARGSTLTTPSSDTKLCLPLSSFYHQVNTKIKLSKLQTTDDVVLVINSITMALGQIITQHCCWWAVDD